MENKIITVKRKTTESEISVTLDFNPIKSDYRKKIKTPSPFLNHMIEHIAWRSGVNVEVNIKLDEFNLMHVICEDLGITFGRAVKEYIDNNIKNGVMGFGGAMGIIDEAMARSVISFENRAYFEINYSVDDMPKETEGVLSEDLQTFLEGFVQGADCTLHVDLLKGKNGHHIWEAIYRAFGKSLGDAFEINKKRQGMTSGVAGKVQFEISKN